MSFPMVVQEVQVIPRCRKGNTQGMLSCGPPSVTQEGTSMVSTGQDERALLLQSPHLLVTTVPLLSTMVAHQGTGEGGGGVGAFVVLNAKIGEWEDTLSA